MSGIEKPPTLVLLGRSALCLAGLVIPLVAVEILLRLFGPILPGNYETGVWAQGDPVVGHVHTPNSSAWVKEPEFTTYLRFNSDGLRGDDLTPTDEAQRVLALVDSFIEAKQVPEEQTLTELLTAAARQRSGPPEEWLNGGVFDWGPVHEYLYLRQAGSRLAPRLVVQFFYVGNDIDDCYPRSHGELRGIDRPTATIDDDGALLLLPWTPHQQTGSELLLGWLSRRSTAFRAFETGVVDKVRYQPRSRQPIEGHLLDIFDSKENRSETRAWQTVDALLGATHDEAQRVGARFVLVIVPSKWQVHREDWADLLAERGLVDDDHWTRGRPDRRLARLATARGIPVLDLLSTLRDAASRGERLYFRRDIHWNALGHAVAADTVSRFVRDEGLLPPANGS